MKHYLILTYNVCNMGGGQLFVLRRAKHLKNKGYDVHIVVSFHTDYFPLKEQFDDYHLYIIPEMGDASIKYTKKEVDSIICSLLNSINTTDELLIESHTLPTIEWGELIAKKIGARHLAYPLAEPKVTRYHFQPGKNIFNNKLEKGEFYSCSSTSLKEIFERNINTNHFVNIGYDENEMFERCEPELMFRKEKGIFVIATITRLDKEYVEPLVDSVIQLARKYPNNGFRLIIAGGSKTPGREEFLHTYYGNKRIQQSNLDIVYTGYIDKLGKDIFSITDVFVGMGTAVINSISQKCVTINIDPRQGMRFSSGFFGTDTNNFAYSESGKLFSIFEKLEESYVMDEKKKNDIIRSGRKLYEEEFEMNSCFEKMDSIISSLSPAKKDNIYEVSTVYRTFIRFGYKLYRFLNK